MQLIMIYSAPFKVATLTMYSKEIVICYQSDPLNGILYNFTENTETLDVYEFCVKLMEHLEKIEEFENIEIMFKKMLKLKLKNNNKI